ncbi:testis-specific Y-encoded-like protein 2 [Sorex fumeus]|uniref:testis-specific Y-encoded-like protein 2 n=1 Tax=Sorex fumeus TaxID=62283 RepID=UPI0024AD05E0|nr:testis-specific Y-encoded-like protein 2 [Sorex fumeus]
MDRPDEGPPAKALRLSDPESPPSDTQPPPPPLLRLPLPPPQQRPRPREETEAAQVLADMRGVGLGLGPALPPPPPYVILEEGGIRAYFTLGAEGSDWEPGFESGFGDPAPPPGNLEALTAEDASAGSVEIDFQVVEPSSFSEEKALETCSAGGWEPQMLATSQGGEEAVILVEDDDEDEKESVKKKRRRRRRRRQRKVKRGIKEVDAEKIECVLHALENVQLDLEAVNIKAGKAFLRLKRKFIQLRRPYLEQRDLIIQDIPGFWIKAFLNHPRISMLINQRDKDIFRYLTNLQVQDLRHISMGYKMKLYFQTNPYFTNTVIVKEFQRSCSGRLVSHSTPIRWHRGQEPQDQEPQGRKMKNQQVKRSFFSWFSNHSLPETDIIADIIKNDLWVNPLRYYMMGEGGYRANKKKQEKRKRKNRNGYKVVILEDYDDYHIVKDVIDDTSDSDFSDFEYFHGIRISDFMETTDCFDTTDSDITEENLCDHNENHKIEAADDDDNPKDNQIIDNESFDDETTDEEGPGNNSENSDYNKENPDISGSSDDDSHHIGYKKPKGGNLNSSGSNQDSSESAIEFSDNDSSEGSDDDDGNEGDDESSGDDDDKDFEDSENDSEYFAKNQANRNNQNDDEDKVENFLESSVEEEEPDTEEGSKQEDEENSEEERSCEEDVFKEIEREDDIVASDMQEVLLVQNTWVGPGKNSGRTV